MKFWSRIILILAASFLVGIFAWAIFAPKPQISERIYQTLQEQEKRADLSFKDVTFEEVVSSVKYWQLRAKSATVNKSTEIATLKDAQGTFFKKGKPVLRFRSPAALWDMKNKEILLDQPLGYDVKLDRKIAELAKSLKSSRFSIFNLPRLYDQGLGYWFQANNLSWRVSDQKLLCTGGIILNKGEITGYAQRLEGDVGLERIKLEGKPRIVISPDGSAPITLEADSFEVLSEQDVILAKGRPRISWEDAKITSQELKYDQKKCLLELMRNVRVKYRDINAWGDSAKYLTERARVTLLGRARAIQGDNKLSGEEVNVLLKQQKIAVVGKGKVIITEEDIKK